MLPDSPVGIEDDSEPTGAPVNEIEITPEMIHVGVGVLLAMDTRFESHEDVVKELIVELFKNNPLGGAYLLKCL
jgi:hypothetical protein